MRDGGAVAAEGEGRAVEDGGFARVFPRDGPVPVGQGAAVAALFAEGFLVEPDEVTVETEEAALRLAHECQCQLLDCEKLDLELTGNLPPSGC